MSERLRVDDPEELRPQAQETPAPQEEPRQEPQRQDGEQAEEQKEPDEYKTFKERLDRERREKYEARRDADLYRQQLEQIQRQMQRPQGQPGETEAEQRAYARFVAEQQEKDFNAACNQLFRNGQDEYGDFRADVEQLNSVGAGNNRAFLDAVSNFPEGHRIYHALASDLDHASEIMRMAQSDPRSLYRELAKLAVQQATPAGNGRQRQSSRAPEPIRPIGGSSRSRRMEDLPVEDWVRMRDQQEIERRKRGER